MHSPQEVACLITELAKKRGISVNKMLHECGAGASAVDNMKRGRVASSDTIVKISDYFGVTTDYLLKGEENNTNKSNKKERLCIEMKKRYIERKTVVEGLKAYFENIYLNEEDIYSLQKKAFSKDCYCKVTDLHEKTGIPKEYIEKYMLLVYWLSMAAKDTEVVENYYPTYAEYLKMMYVNKCDEDAAVNLLRRLEEEQKILDLDVKERINLSGKINEALS